MEIYIKQNTCWKKNLTAISGEHNIKRSYPSMNTLHCLEILYTVILPFVSQVNTRKDFSTILKIKSEIARSRDREFACQLISPVKQKYAYIKFACSYVTHTKRKSHRPISYSCAAPRAIKAACDSRMDEEYNCFPPGDRVELAFNLESYNW